MFVERVFLVMWSFAKLLQLQLLRVLAPFKASLISEFKRWNRLNRKLLSSFSWIVLSSLISLHFPCTTPDESEDWQKIFSFILLRHPSFILVLISSRKVASDEMNDLFIGIIILKSLSLAGDPSRLIGLFFP